jgi:2-polyprenyl-6-methoxyphenol hydroxylase-like FAD-dependent oxidoreductase
MSAQLSPISVRRFHHAIVAGGSIAGLLAARVLADHFDRVTLVERDPFEPSPEPRPGVPQGRHLHALLVRGREIIETLFPGVTADLCEAGGTLVDAGRDLAWHHAGGWRVGSSDRFDVLCLTRPLLESRIATRVRALPNVEVRGGVRATGLTGDEHGRVTGLRIRNAEGGGPETTLHGDLVVDALGRGSPMGRWVEELGFAPIPMEFLAARVAYATCLFDRPARLDPRPILVTGAPARRSGGIFPVEGNRWLMTLIGFFEESMPKTHDDFLAFARSLPATELWEAARRLTPVSDITAYRFAGSQRRFYERLEHVPGGLISLGDSVCSFNPVYGQGMTVAAVEANLLGTMIAEVNEAGDLGARFARAWFRRIASVIDVAWNGVCIEDLRFPQLAERRPLSLRPIQWYMERVHKATHRSPEVTTQFYRVMNFLDAPTTLFRPRLMRQVLFGRTAASASRLPEPGVSATGRSPGGHSGLKTTFGEPA